MKIFRIIVLLSTITVFIILLLNIVGVISENKMLDRFFSGYGAILLILLLVFEKKMSKLK